MYSSVIQRNESPVTTSFVTSPASAVASAGKPVIKSSVLKSFLAGAFSGSITSILFQPLDLVKTRLQMPDLLMSVDKAGNGETLLRKNHILDTVHNVIRNERYSGLWRGLTPSLYRTVPGVGMYFSSLHWMKNAFCPEPTFYQNMALGFTARSFVGTTMLPITVIKTRYESGSFDYKNVGQALRTIWKLEGAKGLFSGWTATIARDAPYSGLYFMFYSQQKSILTTVYGKELKASVHFQCGIVAGILACIATQPADVVKTQMQLYPYRYRNTVHCVVTILKENGCAGFVRGMLPRCLRKTLISALSWTVFEEIMKLNVKVK